MVKMTIRQFLFFYSFYELVFTFFPNGQNDHLGKAKKLFPFCLKKEILPNGHFDH
jgi:hypothetical protein